MPTTVVQASSVYSFTASAFVPPTLHFTFLSVALSGVTVAVKETFPSTSIACAVVLSSDTLVTSTVADPTVNVFVSDEKLTLDKSSFKAGRIPKLLSK